LLRYMAAKIHLTQLDLAEAVADRQCSKPADKSQGFEYPGSEPI